MIRIVWTGDGLHIRFAVARTVARIPTLSSIQYGITLRSFLLWWPLSTNYANCLRAELRYGSIWPCRHNRTMMGLVGFQSGTLFMMDRTDRFQRNRSRFVSDGNLWPWLWGLIYCFLPFHKALQFCKSKNINKFIRHELRALQFQDSLFITPAFITYSKL